MKHSIFTIILSLFASFLSAQTTVNEAERLFNEGKYSEAAKIYENLLAKNPKDALNNYRLARCYYEQKIDAKSIVQFELAKAKYPKSNYYLGELYQNSYQFDNSEEAFSAFLLQTSTQATLDASKRLNQVKMAAEMLHRIEDIALIDSIIVDKNDFLSAYNLSKDLGSLTVKSSKTKGEDSFDFVKYITQRGDRTIFSDTTNGQFDIFSSHKLLNDWELAESISSEINTSANENYPFLLSDGVTLYFAADGERSIGGYDIFITRFNPEKNDFYTPENVGMPFNSPFNDYMMVIDDANDVGWFASDRFQPENKVIIYKFLKNETKQIIRTENVDSLRGLAQLKFFRKINLEENDLNETSNEKITQYADFKFIINENRIYYSLDEFKNTEAASFAKQLETEKINLKNMQKELEFLRGKYAKSSNEDKAEITPKILQLEQSVGNMKTDMEKLEIKIKNLEISELE